MGDMVEFRSNGNDARGYLAAPSEGAGPGVIVVQEWWGLNDQIKGVCDRLAGEGFTALAPDLYYGELAGHDEMDKAGELMQKLPIDRAARDMSGAVDFLMGHDSVRGNGVGAVGYCMGGRLVLLLAGNRPDAIKAVVSYYGVVQEPDELDASGIQAPVQAHYGTNDDFMSTDAAKAVAQKLEGDGVELDVHYYPDAGHAFANEEDALGTYHDEHARTAWVRTLELLRAHLG